MKVRYLLRPYELGATGISSTRPARRLCRAPSQDSSPVPLAETTNPHPHPQLLRDPLCSSPFVSSPSRSLLFIYLSLSAPSLACRTRGLLYESQSNYIRCTLAQLAPSLDLRPLRFSSRVTYFCHKAADRPTTRPIHRDITQRLARFAAGTRKGKKGKPDKRQQNLQPEACTNERIVSD